MEIFSMKRDGILGPESANHFEPFDQSAPALPFIDAEGIELALSVTLADAEEHFTAGEIVQGRNIFGDH